MKQYTEHNGRASINYFVCGGNPRILISSGIHGDELGVIVSVKKSLEKYNEQLPDFVYIPEVSPSAVQLTTRCNCDGVDLNRYFVEGSTQPEAQVIQKILGQYAFDCCYSFHEDPEHSAFYMYDSDTLAENELATIRGCLQEEGVALFTGIDDPSDPILGLEITDGYRANVDPSQHEGPLESWVIQQKVAQRVFGFEIPGSAEQDVKDSIVDHLFTCFIR